MHDPQRILQEALIVAIAALALAGMPSIAPAQPDAASPPRGAEPSPSPAPGPRVVESDGERYITMDFQDVDLAILVKFMGEITGKNFVMDERVQGKVTVISPTRITPDEAYQVFQSVLQVKGFTTVPSGAAVRIIPTKDAKETSLRTLTDGPEHLPAEEYITRLIPIEQVDAADIMVALQPLVSKDGLITTYPQTNSIIVIDSAANLERLTKLVEELDVWSSRRQTTLIKLEHAAASELAETIQQVLEERPTGAAPPPPGQPAQGQRPAPAAGQIRSFRITPDDRTNTLIVSAAAEQLAQIEKLVERLDVPLPAGSGRINVYYLKYANAEDMLPVLLDVIGQSTTTRSPRQQGQQQTQSSDRRRQRGSSLRRSSAERARRAPGQTAQQGQQGQPAVDFAGDVRITADPATNALIISAAPEDYGILLDVIDKLDIRRRQVYVEAIILEVAVDRLRQLGVELQGALALSDGAAIGRTNLSALDRALSPTSVAGIPGLVAAAVSENKVVLPDGTKVPAQVALLTALQNDTDVNILSAPNLLTTDNEEAEIIVGQNVPFVASRSTSETNLSNVFATIEREDVGITLRLTPQISEGSTVRLAVFEEVSAIVPNALLDANEVGPTTTVRSASTTITVKDAQTIVIGGLISDSITARDSSVPFIADIPVIGHLFRNTNKTRSKINLLIFLTPHIIKDEADAAAVSTAERDRFQDSMRRSGTPRRVPDPLDRPSFELREEQEMPALGEPGTEGASAADGGALLGLADVQIDRRNDGARIRLDVGATPVRVKHYALEKPGRYVIDLYGASAPAKLVDIVAVRDTLVRRVRVARHAGRMRIVLDLKTDDAPAYEVTQEGGTILLTLGSARAAATEQGAER